MDALDLVTVLCGVLALGVAAVLALCCARLARAVQALEEATEDFERVAVPAVQRLTAAAEQATGEVDRLDDLLDVATAVGERVDTATEATYRALTSPVIKGVALATGTRRAARRLRGRDEPTAPGRAAIGDHDRRHSGGAHR